MNLGLARLDLPPDSPAAAQVAEAHEQAKQALAELRELIRGVHPQVLTDRGLAAAVRDVAGRSPVPVDVDIALPRRLPAAVEETAYFVVCEALANVAKHSGATRAAVRGRLLERPARAGGPRRRRRRRRPGRRQRPDRAGRPDRRRSTAGCGCPARPAGRPCCGWSCRARSVTG